MNKRVEFSPNCLPKSTTPPSDIRTPHGEGFAIRKLLLNDLHCPDEIIKQGSNTLV